MTIETRSGGQLIVDSLLAQGVDTVTCVPGESYLPVINALYDASNQIKVVTCRHENGAANMAEAYGKLTGRPGVCMVTRGPGACNASIGLHTGFQDSTPMVVLIGQVARPFIGREAFQEVDFNQMYGPLTKWVTQIDAPEDIPEIMARAFEVAVSGRPGPVAIALPEDMLFETASVAQANMYEVVNAAPSQADMDRLAGLLAAAKRPLAVVGGGGWPRESRNNVVAFADTYNLPVTCSFRCHDIFDNGHRNFVGELGIATDPALSQRVRESDLLLVMGARLGEITTQGYTLIDEPVPAQTLIHVHQDKDELGRVYQPKLAIHSGMAEFTLAAARLHGVRTNSWDDWAAQARADYEAAGRIPEYGGDLDLGQVMAELRARIPPESVVTTDAGNFSGWAHRFLAYGGGRRLLGATSGAMGYGVPGAIMAKILAPERMAVCFVGDGGFGMTGQELATAVQNGLDPIILVFNNRMFGTIRMHQEREYPGRTIATDLVNPDYVALAEAHGAHGELVERTEDFAPAFDRARKAGKAAVIELRMDPDVISTRTTLTALREAALKGK